MEAKMAKLCLVTVAAATIVFALLHGAVASATEYPTKELYNSDHRRWIDSACNDARTAANALFDHAARVTPDEAVDFQKAFVACANRKQIVPELDKLKYLSLAAAGAAYVEALGASGARRAAALSRGYVWSAYLSPKSDGQTLETSLVRSNSKRIENANNELGPTTSAGLYMPGDTKQTTYQLETKRNPFGANSSWLFGGDAEKLRDAFSTTIKADLEDAKTHRQALTP